MMVLLVSTGLATTKHRLVCVQLLLLVLLADGRRQASAFVMTPHRNLPSFGLHTAHQKARQEQGQGQPPLSEGLDVFHQQALTQLKVQSGGRYDYRDDGDDEEDDWNKVKVPRRGRGRRYEEDYDGKDAFYEDDTVPSSRSKRSSKYYDEDEDEDELDEEYDDDEDEDDDEYNIYDDEEETELLSNVLIPNPLLDSMDPDGAAERFPEMARDPRFWFDMVLFVSFLNFLSYAAPRDPYPDLPIDLWAS